MKLRVIALAALLAGTWSCGQSSESTHADASKSPCTVDGGCIACGAQGNELHVGEYCTRGGGECDDNGVGGNAILCTVDFKPEAPPMCTRVCQFNSNCGSNAICAEDPMMAGQKACVPVACAPGNPGIEPDAATDAGTSADASSNNG